MPNLTPLPVDAFARTMAEGFDDRNAMRAPGGFAAFFGYRPNGAQINFAYDSSVFDTDIILGSEKLAPTIPRAAAGRIIEGAKNTQEQRFTSLSRTYPLIEVEGDIHSEQLTKRVFNEQASESDKTRKSRLQDLAGAIRSDHMRRIARTYEFMAAQSIITGKQPAIMGTTNDAFLYDWLRPAGNFITVGTAWSDSASLILNDLDAACAQIRAKGRQNPDMAVLSSVDADAFVNNAQIKELADNRGYKLISVGDFNEPRFQRFVDGGFVPFAKLRTPKGFSLTLFTYLDIYDDENGDPQPYLPANKTIVASSDARCDLHFGPASRLPVNSGEVTWYQDMFGMNMLMPQMPVNLQGTDWVSLLSGSVYCDAYPSANKKNVTVRDQAAPVFPTTHTAAFVTITTAP